MNTASRIERLKLLEERNYRKKYFKLKSYAPYQKQKDFHRAGKKFSERCLGAGNQTGKTLAGSMELAMHATGLYDEEWDGAVFPKPIVAWVGGDTSETIRDTTQKLLVGRIQDPDGLGSGSIPKDYLTEAVRSVGIKDALDHVKVRHKSGGTSLLFFKSYEKGRQKWQGETVDIVWFDEEPPPDIYSEGKTRTNNGQLGQFTMLTYTPLLGMTEVSYAFYTNPSPHQSLIKMEIWDVDHYTQEDKEKIVAGYPDHEREARAKGQPILGSGRIFPITESKITCEPFKIPPYFERIIGADFGYDHPQAWVNIAYDPDSDIIYITHEYRERKQTPEVAAIAIRRWNVTSECRTVVWQPPVAWPHDGLQHDKGSGLQLADQYREAGINMYCAHATHPAGGFGTEAGISELLSRMEDGRLKVFSHCSQWFEEFRLYHRKDGKIVKERDDLMSATRMVGMMLRIAQEPDLDEEDEDYMPRSESPTGY